MLSREQIAWIEKEIYVICPLQYKEDEFCKDRKAKVKLLRDQVRKRITDKLLKEKFIMKVSIAGCEIETENIKAKSLSELEALDIFSHLPKDEAKLANKQLWESLQPKEQAKDKKPASDKTSDNPVK